ncbi:MAG: ABC transporter permease [bacterium]|nr:ABC transporter permease [bacterium]
MKNKSPNQIRPFFSIALYSLIALFRNRATVFFGFAFPLIFISVFGLLGSNGTSITIGVPDGRGSGPIYQALSRIEAVSIKKGSEKDLKEQLSQGRLAGVLVIDKNNSPSLFISQANPQQAAAVISMTSGVVDKLNLKLANVTNPVIKLDIEEVSGRKFSFIDFFLPGMIGFALLTTSITSTSFGLIFLKKTLVLKRIFATPTKGLTILLGQGASRMVMVLLQTLVIVLVGVFVFKFTLVHGLFTLTQVLILSVIGLLSFLGFGLFVAGIANDENTAAPVANLFVLPQFLVAGTFFPIDALPSWIQPVVSLLPLSFFNTAIRKITVEGLSIDHLVPQFIGLAVWAVIAYILASRTFRWE